MIIDIGTIEIIFNKLWNKPIDNLKTLLFKDKNKTLLKKYNISLT